MKGSIKILLILSLILYSGSISFDNALQKFMMAGEEFMNDKDFFNMQQFKNDKDSQFSSSVKTFQSSYSVMQGENEEPEIQENANYSEEYQDKELNSNDIKKRSYKTNYSKPKDKKKGKFLKNASSNVEKEKQFLKGKELSGEKENMQQYLKDMEQDLKKSKSYRHGLYDKFTQDVAALNA